MNKHLHLINMVDPRILYGSESGKSLSVLDEAQNTDAELPEIDGLRTKNNAIFSSLAYCKNRYKALCGTCYRPDGLIDLLAHEAITKQMVKDDPWESVDDAIEIAYRIASETINNYKNGRATHPSIDNAGYLNAYLVPAGFIAWSKSIKKACVIWYAALLTKSRAFFPAMIAGVLAYTWKGKRPPLFALALPIVLPAAFIYILAYLVINYWRKGRLLRLDGPRKGFKRVALQARKDKKIYGYGNFGNAIEDYYERYVGKYPTGATFIEQWSDKAHNEFLELDVTVGVENGKLIREIYWAWLKRSPNAWVAGAFASHMVLLSFLFRTQAASIQEDFLIALIESRTYHAEEKNPFLEYIKSNSHLVAFREAAWKNYAEVYMAFLSQDQERMNKALDAKPVVMEGRLSIPKNIEPDMFEKLKAGFEETIQLTNESETLYRYWYILKSFNDIATTDLEIKASYHSPKRMAYEIKKFV